MAGPWRHAARPAAHARTPQPRPAAERRSQPPPTRPPARAGRPPAAPHQAALGRVRVPVGHIGRHIEEHGERLAADDLGGLPEAGAAAHLQGAARGRGVRRTRTGCRCRVLAAAGAGRPGLHTRPAPWPLPGTRPPGARRCCTPCRGGARQRRRRGRHQLPRPPATTALRQGAKVWKPAAERALPPPPLLRRAAPPWLTSGPAAC
jgi:hypothetical protein